MLPAEMTTPSEEAEFGRYIVIISILWTIATVGAGIALVLMRPWLSGVF